MNSKTIEKIALAVFKDKKLLLVKTYKHGDKYLLLGGKIENGESDVECLNREVMEEVSATVDQESIKFLNEFTTPAHDKPGVTLHVKLYSGTLRSEPTASSEIESVRYFDSTIEEKFLTEMTEEVIAFLKQKKLIN